MEHRLGKNRVHAACRGAVVIAFAIVATCADRTVSATDDTPRPFVILSDAAIATLQVRATSPSDPTATAWKKLQENAANALDRDFSPEDFARLHPGGALGRKLLLRVEDLMHTGDEIPAVQLNSTIQETILEMTSKRLGTTLVLDFDGRLAGIFTDGDLRRLVEKNENFMGKTAGEIMVASPKTVSKDELADKALNLMESFQITALPVTDKSNIPIGILHIHDLLKRKIV